MEQKCTLKLASATTEENLQAEAHMDNKSAHVLLAVCGGIAAYKACEVLRGLQHAGVDVSCCMTCDATRFVGPTTFEALSKHPVLLDLYGNPGDPIPHVRLAKWADLVLIIPATANVIAKLAAGIADDALTTTILAIPAGVPILIAPAMNTHMWEACATKENVERLERRGMRFVLPVTGTLACGELGAGKLAAVDDIVRSALDALDRRANLCVPKDFAGISLLVTAGPTHEAIDPVRYIANASSGKMGFAIAKAASQRQAKVTLITGPVGLATPLGVRRQNVSSAAQMHEAAMSVFAQSDIAICAAAVADYTPVAPADHKLKKDREELTYLKLKRTPDILADLSAHKGRRIVVGFAAETENLISNAQDKLARKGCNLIVANDVSRADSTFGSDTDRVVFVSAERTDELPTLKKSEVAERLLDRILALYRENSEEQTGGFTNNRGDRAKPQAALDATVVMPRINFDERRGVHGHFDRA